VAHHQELGILGHLTLGQHHQAAEQATNDQVDDRNDHSAMVPAGKPVHVRSSNRAPHDDLAAAYKQLVAVERGWKDMKGA
jgi:hypothetical protein